VCVCACVQKACYEEQVRHVGKDMSTQADYDALKECTLLERCLKESLRLRPPLVTIMRMCKTPQVIIYLSAAELNLPHVRPGHPFSPSSLSFPRLLLFLLFPLLVGLNYFLLLSIPFLSTRIVSLLFQAGGRRKRPNLGLVCCVYFVLSVFLS